MNYPEKYDAKPISQDVFEVANPTVIDQPQQTDQQMNLVMTLLKRWKIILFCALTISAIGLAGIWHYMKPYYQATAAIQVAPVIPSILFSDIESDTVLPMYRNFMNTQADLIKNDKVVQRVADDLVERQIYPQQPQSQVPEDGDGFMEMQYQGPVDYLKELIAQGDISVIPERGSELIKICMDSSNPQKAEQIVNSFVRAYMAIEGSSETERENNKLLMLETERKALLAKLERQRETINQMSLEYGTGSLTKRHEMMLQRVAAMQAKYTETQTNRISLEVKAQLLKNSEDHILDPEKVMEMHTDYMNSDLMIKNLTTNVVHLEQSLIVSKQVLAPTNPELKRKEELYKSIKARLEERRKEVDKNFYEMVNSQFTKKDEYKLANVQSELKQTIAMEERLEKMLAEEDTETMELGRKHLAIQGFQEQYDMTKEVYDRLVHRITELELENKRPGRVSVAYFANTAPIQDARKKYSVALMAGALALSGILALLRERLDVSLANPDDVAKRVGIRIIGTTSCTEQIKRSEIPKQLTDDYQAIRANMKLINENTDYKIITVTSPGPGDGKTTFAVNLATSFAKAGEKVLLIDGDLRKPDIAETLNIPPKMRKGGLQSIIFNQGIEESIYTTSTPGMYVMASDNKNSWDAIDLLSRKHAAKSLRKVADNFDHVIVDTPPVLAFADAILLAKMSDAAIVTSFAMHTSSVDLRLAISRLEKAGVKIIGTVMNNVKVANSYHRYGYGYGYGTSSVSKRKRNAESKSRRKRLLLDAIKPMNKKQKVLVSEKQRNA